MAVVWGAPHAALYSKAGANVIVPSDDASYITDSNLVVDGGLTAGTGLEHTQYGGQHASMFA